MRFFDGARDLMAKPEFFSCGVGIVWFLDSNNQDKRYYFRVGQISGHIKSRIKKLEIKRHVIKKTNDKLIMSIKNNKKNLF